LDFVRKEEGAEEVREGDPGEVREGDPEGEWREADSGEAIVMRGEPGVWWRGEERGGEEEGRAGGEEGEWWTMWWLGRGEAGGVILGEEGEEREGPRVRGDLGGDREMGRAGDWVRGE
jgi:hypothetical protein